jgi:flagellar protein FliS
VNYHQQAMASASGTELVVGLYDAAIRSLYRAQLAVEEDDVYHRRQAVSKVVDIFAHLQAGLNPDAGTVAHTLSDFYAVMITMTLEASYLANAEDFGAVIACVRNVRDAWTVVAQETSICVPEQKLIARMPVQHEVTAAASASRWSA